MYLYLIIARMAKLGRKKYGLCAQNFLIIGSMPCPDTKRLFNLEQIMMTSGSAAVDNDRILLRPRIVVARYLNTVDTAHRVDIINMAIDSSDTI